MIKAVVFDFDGLILDTETAEYESFQAMYLDHGLALELEKWGLCIGTDGSAFDAYQYLEECLGKPIDRETARRLRKKRFAERMLNVEPRPGVKDYLVEARSLGLSVGLASSSTRAWVQGYLEQHGLLEYFQCIKTRDDVAAVKPDPALYRDCLVCLGAHPGEAIAFEDSPNGSLAAKRAGLRCVIVPNDITTQLTFGDYDLRLASMADLTLSEVIGRMTRNDLDL